MIAVFLANFSHQIAVHTFAMKKCAGLSESWPVLMQFMVCNRVVAVNAARL